MRSRLLLSVAVVGVTLGGVAAWLALSQVDEDNRRAPIPRERSEPPLISSTSWGVRQSLAQIVGNPTDFRRNADLYALLADTGLAEVEALLADVASLPASPHRYDVARVLYTRFAELDPDAAADHVVAANYHSSWVTAVFRAWAHTDVDAAVDRAATLESDAKAIAAEAILELDLPPGRQEQIAGQLDGKHVLAAIHARKALTGAERDFAAAWASALRLFDIPQQPDAPELFGRRAVAFEHLGPLARRWARHDPVAAMAAVVNARPPYDEVMAQVVLQVWASADPPAAVAWLAGQQTAREGWARALMQGLTKRGVDEAIRAIDSIPARLQGEAALGLVSALRERDAGDVDFQILIDWYGTLEAPSGRLTGNLSRAFAAHDPQRAMAWAQTLNGRAQKAAFNAAATQLARSDPALPKRLVGEIESTGLRREAAQQVVFSQAFKNPRATLEWARSFPVEADRPQLERQAITMWARVSPRDATREVLAIRDAESRDATAARIARDVARKGHADLAEDLFNAAESVSARRRIATALVSHYTETEPDRAKADFYRAIAPERVRAVKVR
ncbi:MAG: hypothetical protein F4089_11310 [Gammaproteobacteria bacterium]|nr:hypothetical protein [Gammaproteobacteria bacterium]MYJ75639.1 hypothetical protein [Gammaproteobacteria bacterium]